MSLKLISDLKSIDGAIVSRLINTCPRQKMRLFEIEQPADNLSSFRILTSPKLKATISNPNFGSYYTQQQFQQASEGTTSTLKKFINNLREFSNQQRLNNLAQNKKLLLTQILDKNLGDKITNQSNRLSQYGIPLFNIHSRLTKSVELILLLLIISSLFVVPVSISFIKHTDGLIKFYIFVICTQSFVKINQQRITNGQLLNDRMALLMVYYQDELISDIVRICSLFLFSSMDSLWSKMILTTLYLFLSIKNVNSILMESMRTYKKNSRLNIQKLWIIMQAIIILHVVSCFWHSVGQNSTQQQTWIKYYEYDNKSNFQRYQTSLFWVIMTTSTVGQVLINPQNQEEIIFQIIAVLLTWSAYVYLIDQALLLLREKREPVLDKLQKVRMVDDYLEKFEVNFELSEKIRTNLLLMIDRNCNLPFAEELIKNFIKNETQKELKHEIVGARLKNCQIFQQFSSELLERLVAISEEVIVPPNDFIYQRGQSDDNSLYILKSGSVTLLRGYQFQLQANEYFGEEAFFSGFMRNHSALSVESSSFIKIQRQRFIALLESFQLDQEVFHLQKYIYQFGSDRDINFKSCGFCGSCSHRINNCDYINVMIDREKVIKAHLYSAQERSKAGLKWRKNMGKSVTALKQLQFQRMVAKEIQAKLFRDDSSSYDGQLSEKQPTSQNFSSTETFPLRKSTANLLKDEDDDDFSPILKRSRQFDSELSQDEINIGPKALHQINTKSQIKLDKILEEHSNGSQNESRSYNHKDSPKSNLNKKKAFQNYMVNVKTNGSQTFHMQDILPNPGTVKLKPYRQQSQPSKLSLTQPNSDPQNQQEYKHYRHTELSLQFRSQLQNYENLLEEMDKLQNYQKYFPEGNCDVTIQKIQKVIRKQFQTSAYTFSQDLIRRISRSKNILMQKWVCPSQRLSLGMGGQQDNKNTKDINQY